MSAADSAPDGGGVRLRSGAMAAAVVLAAVAGTAVVSVDARHTAASTRYSSTPQFLVWALIVIAVWGGLPIVWMTGRTTLLDLGTQVRAAFRRFGVLPVGLVVVVLLIGFVSGQNAYTDDRSHYYSFGMARILVTYAAATIALAPCALVFAEVHRQLRVPPVDPLERVKLLVTCRRAVGRALTTFGAIVSAGVLTTGAQRQAYLAAHRDASAYPAVYVVVWGAAASAFIIAMFVPVRRRLDAVGANLVDETLPLLAPGAPGWTDRLDERQALNDLLGLSRGLKDTLDSTILIAGPLVTAAVSFALPGSTG